MEELNILHYILMLIIGFTLRDIYEGISLYRSGNYKARRHLGFPNFQSRVSESLSDLLQEIMNQNITDFKVDRYHIEFKANGVLCKLWNANKYYAWLSHGEIGSYQWEDERPDVITMLDFKHFIDAQTKNQVLDSNLHSYSKN